MERNYGNVIAKNLTIGMYRYNVFFFFFDIVRLQCFIYVRKCELKSKKFILIHLAYEAFYQKCDDKFRNCPIK